MAIAGIIVSALIGPEMLEGQILPPGMLRMDPSHPRIILRARYQANVMLLRWFVTDPSAWERINEEGWVLERAEIRTGASKKPLKFEVLTHPPVMPWDSARWASWFERAPIQNRPNEPDYAMIASTLFDELRNDDRIRTESGPDAMSRARQMEQQRSMRFHVALLAADRDACAATGLGLLYIDRTVKPGKTYQYRIRPAGKLSGPAIDAGIVKAVAGPAAPTPPLHVETAEQDCRIIIQWPNAGQYSASVVERSEDGGKTYKKLTASPMLSARSRSASDTMTDVYNDAPIVNYRPYKYKLHGVTPFGTEELICEIEAMGRDRTPPCVPELSKPVRGMMNHVTLKWQVTNPAADLAGFLVFRDTSASGSFPPLTPQILPPGSRSFIDSTAGDMSRVYIVAAVDTAGNQGRSMPVWSAGPDDTALATVTSFTARYDANRKIVTTAWTCEPRPSVRGFSIYRAIDGAPMRLWIRIDDKEARFCDDRELLGAKTLEYAISIIHDPGGESEPSAAARVVTQP
jgi:hypothetical protein